VSSYAVRVAEVTTTCSMSPPPHETSMRDIGPRYSGCHLYPTTTGSTTGTTRVVLHSNVSIDWVSVITLLSAKNWHVTLLSRISPLRTVTNFVRPLESYVTVFFRILSRPVSPRCVGQLLDR
jgi:hypothetical protein